MTNSKMKTNCPTDIKPQRRVKAFMALHGIRVKELANRLNVTPSNVTQMLSDKNDMNLSSIQRIADALGADIREFFN